MERVIELLRSVEDGALAIDRMQRIVFWNDACETLLGFSASEAVGRACFEILGGTAADGCVICQSDCVAMLGRRRHEAMRYRNLAARHKDGRLVWIGVSTILVPSSWSELSVLIHLIRDVTTQKNIESLVATLTSEMARLNGQVAVDAPDVADRRVAEIHLTRREHDVLLELSAGRSTAEIAQNLHITQATVRNHIHKILSTLGVRNRLEAVVQSLRTGLL